MSDDGKTNILQLIRDNDPFNPDNALSIYRYGSMVYGTDDDESDEDFIIVTGPGIIREDVQVNNDNFSCTVYDENRFVSRVRSHDISLLECIWLPKQFKIKETLKFVHGSIARWSGFGHLPKLKDHEYALNIHMPDLRKEISGKSSNSFVKAKKKFEVEKQYRLGKKSLFHALRIVMFGIQIASDGKITNYQCANEFWERIKSNPSMFWSDYKKIYKPIYNGLMTEFRRLAPKKEWGT